jgi:hypothetical protein
LVVREIGKLAPEIVKPLPITVAALTVTADAPVDVRINDCVAGEFRFTLPKAIVVAFRLSVGASVPNCSGKISVTLPALAVSVAVCAELTADAVAEKLAVVDPATTVTEAGTLTAELLLARFTAKPPLAAAALTVTVQLSLPAPVTAAWLQLKELNSGEFVALAVVPTPLSPIVSFPSAVALLPILNCPAAVPVALGEKFTFNIYVPPAAIVIGRSPSPLTENGCPDTLTCETVTAADP